MDDIYILTDAVSIAGECPSDQARCRKSGRAGCRSGWSRGNRPRGEWLEAEAVNRLLKNIHPGYRSWARRSACFFGLSGKAWRRGNGHSFQGGATQPGSPQKTQSGVQRSHRAGVGERRQNDQPAHDVGDTDKRSTTVFRFIGFFLTRSVR